MTRVTINASSRTDKAGRTVNQDAILLWQDVSSGADALITNSTLAGSTMQLGPLGALFAVSDGMGSELASVTAIKEIQAQFSRPLEGLADNPALALDFMKRAIISIDRSLKQLAIEQPDSRGLGCTLSMVWLLGDKALCAWCGDCRIYRFNKSNGLVRLSHDHTYVQTLVDNGKISPEDSFDHPDVNLITRTLGDSGEEAKPELAEYQVYQDDIFLICSDGLCSVLPDSKISDIMRENNCLTDGMMRELWRAGDKAGWKDNTSIILCRIIDGGEKPGQIGDGYPEIVHNIKPRSTDKKATQITAVRPQSEETDRDSKTFKIPVFLVSILALFIAAWFAVPPILEGLKSEPGTNAVSYDSDIVNVDTQPHPYVPDSATRDTVATPSKPEQRPTDNHPSAQQVKSTKTTGERAKASFSKRLNNLADKRAEFDNIMRDGTINASNRKKIKNYTASIARLAKESRHSHYVLTESEKETLASLQTYANKLNRYLSQVQ